MRKIKYIIIGIVTGISVMLGLANIITTSFEENLLQKFASNAVNQTNIITDSIYKELDAANDITNGICSDDDIDKLRFVVFQSKFAADIGRIANQQILCTAGWGKIAKPTTLPKPELVENKDIFFWSNTVGVLPQITANIFTKGNTIYFISPTTFSLIQPVDKQYNAALISKKDHFIFAKIGEIDDLLTYLDKKYRIYP